MNILHGESAGGSFRVAFNARVEEMLMFRDDISCGPIREFTDINSWSEFRGLYWNRIHKDAGIEFQTEDFGRRDFYSNFQEIESAAECKLWIGTGLSDQLLLSFIVYLFDRLKLAFGKLSIYQFDKIRRNDGKSISVPNLGVVRPDQIMKHPTPWVLNDKQIQQAKKAWEAFTNTTPEKYLEYMSTRDESMPLLQSAMSFIFYRFPKEGNGLSVWDEILLKYTKDYQPETARIIGYTLTHEMEKCLDWVGDLYLTSRLKKMGMPHLKKPLVKLNTLDAPIRKTEVELSPHGELALEGKINVIKENGIDDWVGGVHLDSINDAVWYRNDTITGRYLKRNHSCKPRNQGIL